MRKITKKIIYFLSLDSRWSKADLCLHQRATHSSSYENVVTYCSKLTNFQLRSTRKNDSFVGFGQLLTYEKSCKKQTFRKNATSCRLIDIVFFNSYKYLRHAMSKLTKKSTSSRNQVLNMVLDCSTSEQAKNNGKTSGKKRKKKDFQ